MSEDKLLVFVCPDCGKEHDTAEEMFKHFDAVREKQEKQDTQEDKNYPKE